ncbi:hypothetical protein HAX54_047006, partial [Datura stramonium]|nr:hypothetical protein [Datura stramonium]
RGPPHNDAPDKGNSTKIENIHGGWDMSKNCKTQRRNLEHSGPIGTSHHKPANIGRRMMGILSGNNIRKMG